MRSRFLAGSLLPICLLLSLASLGVAQERVQAGEDQWYVFTEEQSLSEAIDGSAALLGVSIEYDPALLQGSVTMRMAETVTPRGFWTLTNRALFQKGFTSIQAPGSTSLTIVPIAEAAKLARIEEDLGEALAGFVKVLVPVHTAKQDELTQVVGMTLSKSGTVTAFKDSKAIVIADLKPHVEQAVEAVRLFDATPSLAVEEYVPEKSDPVKLVALMERIRAGRKAAGAEDPPGSLLALSEDWSVLILAPEAHIGTFRELLRRFDRSDPMTTLNYTPRRFGMAETASLVKRVVSGTAQAQEASSMKLVEDDLTGTLVITASAAEHRRIQDLFERLESTGTGPGRPIRSYPVKNRGVEELRDLLEGLLAEGALDEPEPVVVEDRIEQGPTAPLTDQRPPRVDAGKDVVVAVDKGSNRLIAMGQPRMLDQLGRLIEELDVKHTQVLVEAIAVSLTEGQTRSLGVELRRVGTSGDAMFQLGSLFGLGSPDPNSGSLLPVTGTGFAGVVLDPGDFSAAVRALATVNDGRTVTIPKVLVNNNETANLGSVVQSPYASTNASDTVATTSFGGTLDAGTQITVTPQIAEGDLLILNYQVSLSSFVGEASDPSLPPPRQENSLASVATVPDGFAVVVGGLDLETESDTVSKVPLLGDIPGLGALFRNSSKTRSKSRFFVFLRCSVMRGSTFEELRYLSEADLKAAGIDDGLPELEPRIIR